ncbi:uncharacterized protein LOC129599788 [Paramacrobiotus metropolitanus]|uniref:uncharacterized protein LOC129599788 n=1 Tax=Paramacrobiotus metropolitanus TaxID=2943436 RepID=UPI002445ADE7|nr:uncharacterized protein LOC129599788 [Paramacrobiotus metropolitanus]
MAFQAVYLLLCLFEITLLKLTAYGQQPPYLAVHDETFHPDGVLRVTVADIAIDCTTRRSVVINGSVPGPELRFREGQRVWIRVYNDMESDNLTIHWHGLTQRMAPFADGTPMVSQWPIPPHHYFDYELKTQPGDAGTYFYHSHVAFQAITATGALIIEEADGQPAFEYDEDRIILLQDVYHQTDQQIIGQITSDHFTWPGDPDNVLVNGKSRAATALTNQSGPGCEMAVVELEMNRTYRVRFIGGMAYSQVYVTFEEHVNLVLVEVDGRYVMPHVIDHLEITSGQRYSVILFSKSREELTRSDGSVKNRFWIQMETRSPDNNTLLYTILHYKTDYLPVDKFTLPVTPPLVLPNETFAAKGWLEDKLEQLNKNPSNPLPHLEEVTRRVYVHVQEIINFMPPVVNSHFEQDGLPWYENTPMEPYLVTLYKNATKFPDYERALQNGGFDNVTRTFPAKIGEVLEIVWISVGRTGPDFLAGVVFTHPWHAHGGHYWDVGTGTGAYDPVTNEARLRARHGRTITRDTSNLYRPSVSAEQTMGPGAPYTWRAMRIRVQNPGVWMIHCHALQHMIMGMQTVWVFGELADLTPLPVNVVEAGYLTFGGQAYGNEVRPATVMHYWNNDCAV